MKLGAFDGVLGAWENEVFEGGDGWGLPPDWRAFSRAEELGIAGVEVGLKVEELKEKGHRRVEDLKAWMKETGVVIPSMMLGEHNNGGLATWWRGTEADEEVRRAIEWCAAVGAGALLVRFFFLNEPKGRTHREAVAKRLKPLAKVAGDTGVTLAYEGVCRPRGWWRWRR